MGLFDRFRQKKNREQNMISDVAEAPIKSESEGGDELARQEQDSPAGQEACLLKGLDKECAEYPDDLGVVEPHLEGIWSAVKERLETVGRYNEWKEQFLQASQEAELPDESQGADQEKDRSEVTPEGEQEQAQPGASQDVKKEQAQPEVSQGGEQEQLPPESEDASVQIFFSPDKMSAFLYCLEPIGEGKEIEIAEIDSALSDAGVIYGILTQIAAKVADNKEYNVIYPIARGTFPINGKDGKVIDHFAREQGMELREDEKGSIDYKNIYTFKNVVKGDIVCELVYPEQGQDGCDVKGRKVSASMGKMPEIPQGKNTEIDKEQGVLAAGADGAISFQKGKFRVEPQLQLPGNVDGSTGNIDFAGDVVVSGDVQKGFKVTAGGNIIVCGMVEGAELSAGEDIEIRKGMNGSGGGNLTAHGEVRSRFLEQAVVKADEDVSADTIINCMITCGGNILAKKGKGIIIGGSLAAGQSIEARRIGNLSNIKTVLKIGHSMNKEEDIQALESELKEAKETLHKIDANVNYLHSLPSIPENKADIYSQLIKQKKLYDSMVDNLKIKLEKLGNQTIDYSKCHVRGDFVFSTTEISLNYSKIVIQDTTTKCNVYLSQGELIIGTF